MIDLLINKDGSRKNRLGMFNVSGYVNNLRNLPDRALFNRIADGVDTEYEASNKSIREVMQSMRTDVCTDEKYNAWIQVLSNSKTHPIRKKKTPTEPVAVVSDQAEMSNSDILLNNKLSELFEFLAKEYNLEGNPIKVKIKTDKNDTLTLTWV